MLFGFLWWSSLINPDNWEVRQCKCGQKWIFCIKFFKLQLNFKLNFSNFEFCIKSLFLRFLNLVISKIRLTYHDIKRDLVEITLLNFCLELQIFFFFFPPSEMFLFLKCGLQFVFVSIFVTGLILAATTVSFSTTCRQENLSV